ncbi:MAG: phosphotransferase [Ilumatobacteraceae bacterium]
MDVASRVRDLLGAAEVRRLHEGHQSQAFEVSLPDGRRVVAKVLDAAAVDVALVTARVRAVAEVALIDDRVCSPVPIDGRVVTRIQDDSGVELLVLCSEFADGVPFDVTRSEDAELMGVTLAGLHRSLAQLGAHDLPMVAALQAVGHASDDELQLLHGDFNAANLRRRGSEVRVFDFEECGLGPRAFDVANALYMVLFDSFVDGEGQRYRAFEHPFLKGYRTEATSGVDGEVVRTLIDLRVRALAAWLDDLASAPVGIRHATPEWHQTLRGFVRDHGNVWS